MSNIVKHQFTITYESDVDTDTGEILNTKIVSKSDYVAVTPKKSTAPSGDKPTVVLDSNKIQLNDKAIEMIGAEVGDKIDIHYSVVGHQTLPTIGKEDVFGTKGGTKLTKSGTCSYRGAKNEELASRGTVFTLIAHPKTAGLFILSTGDDPIEAEEDTDIVSVDDDIDFSEILEAVDTLEDGDLTEVDSDIFSI